MKILAFSDLHRDLDQAAALTEMSADADVVIGAGDFASIHEGLGETIQALSGIATPTVLVPGNNERLDDLRAAASSWSAATVLHGESIEIEGQGFFGLGGGIPVTPWDWSYDTDDYLVGAKVSRKLISIGKVVHIEPELGIGQRFGEQHETEVWAALYLRNTYGYDAGNRIFPGGRYSLYVGTSQPDARSRELTGVSPVKLEIRL